MSRESHGPRAFFYRDLEIVLVSATRLYDTLSPDSLRKCSKTRNADSPRSMRSIDFRRRSCLLASMSASDPEPRNGPGVTNSLSLELCRVIMDALFLSALPAGSLQPEVDYFISCVPPL